MRKVKLMHSLCTFKIYNRNYIKIKQTKKKELILKHLD